MDLNEMLVFVRVVQEGSFTAAARALGLPKSTVSRRVSHLEERLGARLIQRTTRRLALTDVGRAYYERCAVAVAEAESAEEQVLDMQSEPRGRLRVTVPLDFGWLGALLARFLEQHPEVQIELVGTDRLVNLVDERFDVAVRAGNLADSSLVARRLGSISWWVLASPGYVEAHGNPSDPAALEGHPCLRFGLGAQARRWTLARGGKSHDVIVRGRLVSNDFAVLQAAALAGLGVALLPAVRVKDDVDAGRLVRILDGWTTPLVPLWAVYPSKRHLSPKVQAFVEILVAGAGDWVV